MEKLAAEKRIRVIQVSAEWEYVTYPNKSADYCVCEQSFHGDYDLYWGVDYKDGKEVRRWNLRTVQMIEWEP